MQIIYRDPPGPGWHPLTYIARLAAELFETELSMFPVGKSVGKLAKVRALLPRGKRSNETCLVIAAGPRDMMSLLLMPGWQRFGKVVAWVIDSFWTNDIPKLVAPAKLYDQIFVTTEQDIPAWERITKTKTAWLPWGADVLRLGTASPERAFDLTRIGRQPPEWDNDKITAPDCAAAGVRFQGRTPFVDDVLESCRSMAEVYGRTKYLLAFSNTANPTNYTHPVRQYLTARWVDALAGGAMVAGIAPKAPDIEKLLWPGALLELGTVERAAGLAKIAEASAAWRPEQAAHNHRMALERLDTRWRLAEIAKAVGESPPKLAAELDQIRARLSDFSAIS